MTTGLPIYEQTRAAVESGDLIAPEPGCTTCLDKGVIEDEVSLYPSSAPCPDCTDEVDQPRVEAGPPVHGQWTAPEDTQQGGRDE